MNVSGEIELMTAEAGRIACNCFTEGGESRDLAFGD
jgi:hypothetical protein